MTNFAYDPGWDNQDVRRNHNELLEGEVVLWRNAEWRITNLYVEAKADPDLFGPPYAIDIETLRDPSCYGHVLSKTWVNRPLWREAYRKACELHDIPPADDDPVLKRAEDLLEHLEFDLAAEFIERVTACLRRLSDGEVGNLFLLTHTDWLEGGKPDLRTAVLMPIIEAESDLRRDIDVVPSLGPVIAPELYRPGGGHADRAAGQHP